MTTATDGMAIYHRIMRQTMTTDEAAYFCGVDPRSFARWARTRGIQPLRRQRIGRSTVTVWSVASLLDTGRVAC